MITIIQKPVTAQVCCSNAIGGFIVQNEAFVAEADQDTFELAHTPRPYGISIVTINTILQSIAEGDYTLVTNDDGSFLIFNEGLAEGDKVAIMYEAL